MMRRLALVACLLALGACSWSNSLYHARRLARAAEDAERQGRGAEAGGFWGQAATKADSAWARDPDGQRGAEALWLRAHARAQLGDCEVAGPLLERSLVLSGEAPWREALLLDLARCRERLGDPRALDAALALLASPDTAIRREAQQRAGRALVTQGRWQDGLEALEGLPGNDARLERGVALAGLGRTDDALLELEPLLAASDTAVAWTRLLERLAERDEADAVALLTRLLAFPGVVPRQQAAWHLTVARGAAVTPATRTAQLQAATTFFGVGAAGEARVNLVEDRLARSTAPDDLRDAIDDIADLREADPLAGIQLGRYERLVDALLEDADTVQAGAVFGDLAFFHQAEIARDSLRAPQLASWFFRRLEAGWPDSPYLPKVLLARTLLEPDSAEALRARLAGFPGSPYLAFLRGEADTTFRVLEDSLGRYLGDRAAQAAMRQVRPREQTVNE